MRYTRNPARRPTHFHLWLIPLGQFILLNRIQTIFLKIMTEIEFRIQMMPHLRRFFFFMLVLTHGHRFAVTVGYGYAAPLVPGYV